MRVLIVGWPRSGKTTYARDLAQKLGLEHLCTDPQNKCDPGVRGIPNDLEWGESSQFVANHLLGLNAIVEGVSVPRALRKWREMNPGSPPPVDKVIWLDPRFEQVTSGHMGMGKGIDQVMEELQSWLGDRIERVGTETKKRRVSE